jgi:hypothetical protein
MKIELKKKLKDASYSLKWYFTRGKYLEKNLKILIGEFVRDWTLPYFRKKDRKYGNVQIPHKLTNQKIKPSTPWAVFKSIVPSILSTSINSPK